MSADVKVQVLQTVEATARSKRKVLAELRVPRVTAIAGEPVGACDQHVLVVDDHRTVRGCAEVHCRHRQVYGTSDPVERERLTDLPRTWWPRLVPSDRLVAHSVASWC